MKKIILLVFIAISTVVFVNAVTQGTVELNVLFVDITPPQVFPLEPNGSNFTQSTQVPIAARVIDLVAVDTVKANITLPGGSNTIVVMVLNGTAFVYATNFTSSTTIGTYNITYLANDTSGNLNNTETTFFIITEGNITIRLDGVLANPGDNFTLAGRPTNVTVSGNLPIGGTIEASEFSGFTLSIPAQSSSTNVSPTSIARAGVTGTSTSFTLIPTGGSAELDAAHGNYSILINILDSSGTSQFSQTFNVDDRELASANESVSVPNSGDVGFNAQNLFSTFSTAQAWLNNGGGINHEITISPTTITGANFIVNAGKPTGLLLTVLQNGSTPAANAEVNITENNGFVMFGLPQLTESNVSSIAVGSFVTNSTGGTEVTIIATGGTEGNEASIGAYNVTISVVNSTGSFINEFNLTVDRELKSVNETGVTVPNQGDIALQAQTIFSVFTFVQSWLNQ